MQSFIITWAHYNFHLGVEEAEEVAQHHQIFAPITDCPKGGGALKQV